MEQELFILAGAGDKKLDICAYGNLQWSLPDTGPVIENSFPLKLTDGIIIPDVSGRLNRVSLDGKLLWQRNFDKPGIMTHDTGRLYVQEPGFGKPDTIHCFSLDGGKQYIPFLRFYRQDR